MIILVATSSFQSVLDDYTLTGRIIGWNNLGSLESFFGYGYASSSDASLITSVAGGNVEMLWMSAYYRVGIVGMIAYGVMLIGATWTKTKKGYLIFAFLIFLLAQSLGESYLTSVMSFPSLFEWLILASLSSLESSH